MSDVRAGGRSARLKTVGGHSGAECLSTGWRILHDRCAHSTRLMACPMVLFVIPIFLVTLLVLLCLVPALLFLIFLIFLLLRSDRVPSALRG